jgi:hypothetical protein
VLRQIRGRVPDLLEKLGLGEEVLIEKCLKPLLEAEETVFFEKDGKVQQQVNVAALGIRLSSLRTAFELHGTHHEIQRKRAVRDRGGRGRHSAASTQRDGCDAKRSSAGMASRPKTTTGTTEDISFPLLDSLPG